MSDYEPSGSLRTDRLPIQGKDDAVTESDLQDAVSQNNVNISNGYVQLNTQFPEEGLYNYPFETGSGTTAFDTLAGQDLTLNSEFWVSDDSLTGGYGLQFDGSTTEATGTVPVSDLSEMLICYTIQTTATGSDGFPFIWDEDGSYGLIFLRYESADDQLLFEVGDGSTGVGVATTSSPTDGNKHRVACGITENDQVLIAFDATVENTKSFGTRGPTNDSLILGKNNSGEDYYDGVGDAFTVYDTVSDEMIQEDYDNQPWT